jgi:ubiquinone/menaquinone biosynthesis C-methylase UbiE
VLRSLLHRIDNQIPISNTWFIVNLTEIVGAQSRRPSGLLGRVMGLLMNWRHRPLSQWAIGLMSIQPDDFVLDIGCGGGVAIGEIARIATNGFVAGVDYSEIMVRQALKHNAAAVCATRVEIRNGSISNLPFKDESFDKAYAIESFNFWPDPIAGLKEVHRVLRPRGLVAIATGWSKEMPNQQKYEAMAHKMCFSLYSGSQIVEMLTAAGFPQAQFTVKAGKHWLCAVGAK